MLYRMNEEFWPSAVGAFTASPSFGHWSDATGVDVAPPKSVDATAVEQRSMTNRELSCRTFTFVVYVPLFGSIVLFGLVGNTLSFVVLQFDRHSHAATFLLQVRRPTAPSNCGINYTYSSPGWWRGTVVERRSLAGELSLSCARPAADG